MHGKKCNKKTFPLISRKHKNPVIKEIIEFSPSEISGPKISTSRLSVKMPSVVQNGVATLRIMSDGHMFSLARKTILLKLY